MSCFGMKPPFPVSRHLGLAEVSEPSSSQRVPVRRHHTFAALSRAQDAPANLSGPSASSASSASPSPSATASGLPSLALPPEDLHATKRRLVVIRRQASFAPVSLSVGFRSRTGWQPLCSSRHNQDAIVVLLPLPEPLADYSLFAVLDGHGRAAHRVSAFVAQSLAHNFCAALAAPAAAAAGGRVPDAVDETFGGSGALSTSAAPVSSAAARSATTRSSSATATATRSSTTRSTTTAAAAAAAATPGATSGAASVPAALYRACLRASADLHANGALDVAMTGTTVSALVVHGRTLTCANVGDSRVVLGTREGGALRAVALTRDHEPGDAGERARVEQAGGRVDGWSPAGKDTGPLRVWLPNRRMPGLAVTRVIGDSVLDGIVRPDPELTTHELAPRDAFAVVASDGIWCVMSNDEVVNFVDDRPDLSSQAVTEDLVRHAASLWSEEDGESVDDISAIVVRFNES